MNVSKNIQDGRGQLGRLAWQSEFAGRNRPLSATILARRMRKTLARVKFRCAAPDDTNAPRNAEDRLRINNATVATLPKQSRNSQNMFKL
jgi:hypothetical protein